MYIKHYIYCIHFSEVKFNKVSAGYQKMFENVSNREWNIWSELIIDLIGLFIYVSFLITLTDDGTQRLYDLGTVVTKIIGISIVLGIISHIVINGKNDQEPMDERDKFIDGRAVKVGYYALIVLNILVLWQVVMSNGISDFFGRQNSFTISVPFEIGNAILICLIVSGLLKAITKLALYRKNL